MLCCKMASPVDSNSNMCYISEYIYNGITYQITDTMEVHNRLFTDPDYLNAYMYENLNNTEAAATVAQTPELEDQAPELEDQAPEPEECSARDGNTFDWDKKNIHLLLNSYQERLPKFRDPKFRKKALWKEIVEIFQKKGFYNMDVDTLDRKMRNMKRTHKEIKDRHKQTGAERISWEFYNVFEKIFANDKTINFGPIISSRPPLHTPSQLTTPPPLATPAPLTIPPPLVSPQYSDASNSNINDIYQHDLNNSATQLNFHIADEDSISHTPPTTSLCNSPTFSTSTNPKTREVTPSRSLNSWRKKQSQIEERRVMAIENLSIKVDKANEIQEGRNKLLEALVQHLVNKN